MAGDARRGKGGRSTRGRMGGCFLYILCPLPASSRTWRLGEASRLWLAWKSKHLAFPNPLTQCRSLPIGDAHDSVPFIDDRPRLQLTYVRRCVLGPASVSASTVCGGQKEFQGPPQI
ncbi:uncharacterized protein K452DRAFT_159196 [Aplosporella prunicola CBS 121167]|uniref:Uncharacterized protein n=1 Tax=Aplosporella prunicola CBS 121167 TaxID=1176127 RepID=A0A6A6BHE2_9PEZI|nr:uncharacterized protein K452DRAFT_159196 [Aplosporella prunicola CBS 121167]KAF2143550.1 hypothetical protein K452DRAFT_159196 [Aplosporella prunicola CBS 121167]